MFTKRQSITLMVIAGALIALAVGCVAQQPTVSTAPFPTDSRFKALDAHWGEFVMEFQTDGTLVITRIGDVSTRGTFAVTGDKVTFKNDLCTVQESATYAWIYDGKTLVFKWIDDKCSDRSQLLNQVWTKQ